MLQSSTSLEAIFDDENAWSVVTRGERQRPGLMRETNASHEKRMMMLLNVHGGHASNGATRIGIEYSKKHVRRSGLA